MVELKTKPTKSSVAKFLAAIPEADRRSDCQEIAMMMAKVAKEEPKMWGASIVGFGEYHYVGASGREGDWFMVGVSPRKTAITVYLIGGLDDQGDLLAKLGKHKAGKGCLYINKLADIDLAVLTKLVKASVEKLKKLKKK
ncbi:MAG: DUF1801 domain-containing protein [Candidatus Zixiibacteriota bacterium]